MSDFDTVIVRIDEEYCGGPITFTSTMKAGSFFFITFLIARGLSAQPANFALSGSVTDSATGKPIAAVSIFLNGTSKGTTSREDGMFFLGGIPAGSYQLVISTIAYSTFQVMINTSQLPEHLNVTLHRQATELAVATVEPDIQNGWNKWGATFWEDFIGTAENATSCKIENKDVLRFRYERKTRRLVVSAVEPLVVVNDALGYTVEYRLEGFRHDFSDGMVQFYGYVFFREMTPSYGGQQRVWERARGHAYFGSLRHFMRSLYQGRLKQEGFLILRQVKKPNFEKERVKAVYNPALEGAGGISGDSLRYYRKVLREPDTFIRTVNNYDTLLAVNADQTRSFYFTGVNTIAYINGQFGIPKTSSSMELTYPVSLQIDENGSYSPLQILLLKGAWAKNETVANILPSDYIPREIR